MTSASDYRIRTAGPDDVDAIMDLLDEASRWLHERKLDQWQTGRDRREKFVRLDVNVGTVSVVERDGVVVATITVDEMADADFWKKRDKVRTALYLHRMAVSRAEASKGLGAAMLDWAAEQAEQRGRRRLRLDAWVTNGALQVYYKAQGFTHLRTEYVTGRGSGALFERPAQERNGAGPVLVLTRP